MVEEPAIVEKMRRASRSRGIVMPEINRRQAMVLEGAT